MPNTTVPAAATGLPETTTDPLTRRSILAGLAGAALVAAGPAAAAATADADTELLRLHAELRPLALAYGKLGDRWREAEHDFAEMLAAHGLNEQKVYAAVGLAETFALRYRHGVEGLVEEHNRAGEAVDVITTAMGEIPATTAAGLAAKLDALLVEIGTDPAVVFVDPSKEWARERIEALSTNVAALIGGRVA